SFLNIRGAELYNKLQKIAVNESRLGIPLIVGNDVIHGYRTIVPIPLAEAASWDPELVARTAAMAAKEAAVSGTQWTFAPMVDIARDPRWGRIAEGSGEDPYLGAVLAQARVRGFQGQQLSDPFAVVACPKHFVGYGAAEGGRDYNTVDMSLQTLRDVYLPPFKAAVIAGAGTIMSAFNELNGLPASANGFTLNRILRDEWGFEGFVVSDWNSIGELLNHGIAADPAEAGRKALVAGVDMDMMGFVYINHLASLVKKGEISEELVNEAVRRVLRIKFKKGLFDQPFIDPKLEKEVILSQDHLSLALESAHKSIVLLKNEKQLLPLSKNLASVAVIGPLANDRTSPLGCWSCEGKPEDVITVLQGVRSKIGPQKVTYAAGCDISGTSKKGFNEAIKTARSAKAVILVIGEGAEMSGEASSRSSLDLPGVQEELVKAIAATGKPMVVVLMNGRPLAIPWLAEHVPAIVEGWHLGVQSGTAIADVLFGDYNPSGKLPVTFPRTVGQVPIHYNHKNSGRPPAAEKFTSKYLDLPSTPLFPFGYGLSYTKFEYRDLKISVQKENFSTIITASAEVENVGQRAGDEIVQLYTRDLVGSLARPVKELKGFQRISLQPGEKKIVQFQIKAEALGFYNWNLEYVVEPGEFQLWIGPSSAVGLEGKFVLPE
ncbi:MAG: glycoside hydrolase family 3 C-terminal domain-containing protein, partial [candidate division KSB1 bacterium]|nr:glycoside hydrolase family 3 C-terminal domain-containing protein [candidate division KSB1 bacterium]